MFAFLEGGYLLISINKMTDYSHWGRFLFIFTNFGYLVKFSPGYNFVLFDL